MSSAPIRKPRSLNEAQKLCVAFAAINGLIAECEERRDAAIATINADSDRLLGPLVKECAAIVEKLEPWWGENSALLTHGKRKSAELGGVVLGTRDAKSSIVIAGSEAALREVLTGLRWAKPFLRVSVSLDKVQLASGLDGKHGAALVELGVSRSTPAPVFYIQRTAQAGTQAKVQR